MGFSIWEEEKESSSLSVDDRWYEKYGEITRGQSGKKMASVRDGPFAAISSS